MTDQNNINKDERAIDALLAAAFRVSFPEEISNEEAVKFFRKPPQLSREDQETINSWGSDFVDRLLGGQKERSDNCQLSTNADDSLELEILAMARDKDCSDLDDETRRKIDEERQKALDEDSEQKDDEENESRS